MIYLEGHGCLKTGRCYRWTLIPGEGYIFRGPGISRSHQPKKRHPVWGLVREWEVVNGLRDRCAAGEVMPEGPETAGASSEDLVNSAGN